MNRRPGYQAAGCCGEKCLCRNIRPVIRFALLGGEARGVPVADAGIRRTAPGNSGACPAQASLVSPTADAHDEADGVCPWSLAPVDLFLRLVAHGQRPASRGRLQSARRAEGRPGPRRAGVGFRRGSHPRLPYRFFTSTSGDDWRPDRGIATVSNGCFTRRRERCSSSGRINTIPSHKEMLPSPCGIRWRSDRHKAEEWVW